MESESGKALISKELNLDQVSNESRDLLDQLKSILRRNSSPELLILKDPYLSNKVSDCRPSNATLYESDSRNISIELKDRRSR